VKQWPYGVKVPELPHGHLAPAALRDRWALRTRRRPRQMGSNHGTRALSGGLTRRDAGPCGAVGTPEGLRCPTHRVADLLAAHFARGGWVMWPILATHAVMLALVVERGARIAAARRRHAAVEADVLRWIRGTGDLGDTLALRGLGRYPLGRVARAGLLHACCSLEQAKIAMDAACTQEVARLTRWTPLIRVLVSATVLLGLLGTILGLIGPHCPTADATSKAVALAKGISESMSCTAFALYAALVGLVAYGTMHAHTDRLAADLQAGTASIMQALRDVRRFMRLRDVRPMPPLRGYRD